MFVFGATGMAGHMVTRYLDSLGKYLLFNSSIDKLNDQTIILNVENKKLVKKLLYQAKPDIVINCIGLLIQASKKHPALAIYLNSFFPHYLAELGQKLDFKTIHMSTDCVFSGKKGEYSENDFRDGEDHYARTKALGELINDRDLTFRTSIIGPELNENGVGLFNWFMRQKGTINGYTNVFWTGVTTLELAKAMDKAIEQDLTLLYHLVPENKISKYDLLQIIKEVFNKPIEILKDGQQKHDKSLINTRQDFNYNVPNYRDMLIELRDWMKNWEYGHYP